MVLFRLGLLKWKIFQFSDIKLWDIKYVVVYILVICLVSAIKCSCQHWPKNSDMAFMEAFFPSFNQPVRSLHVKSIFKVSHVHFKVRSVQLSIQLDKTDFEMNM